MEWGVKRKGKGCRCHMRGKERGKSARTSRFVWHMQATCGVHVLFCFSVSHHIYHQYGLYLFQLLCLCFLCMPFSAIITIAAHELSLRALLYCCSLHCYYYLLLLSLLFSLGSADASNERSLPARSARLLYLFLFVMPLYLYTIYSYWTVHNYTTHVMFYALCLSLSLESPSRPFFALLLLILALALAFPLVWLLSVPTQQELSLVRDRNTEVSKIIQIHPLLV